MSFKLNPEIAAAFIDESKSYFLQILTGLRRWAGGDAEALEEPRRLVHTIKGSASMVGLPALAHVSLLFEETLKSTRVTPAVAGDPRPELIWRVLRSLDAYVEGIGTGERRKGELESAILCLRRIRREPEEGDAEALRQILVKEEVSERQAETPPAPVAPAAVSEDLLGNFRQEAEDLLLPIGRSLRMLQAQPDDKDILHALRRGVHTLKGAAQSVGQQALIEVTHRLEDLLESLISGTVAHTPAVGRLVFSAFDTISDFVSGELDETRGSERLQQLRGGFASVAPAGTEAAEVKKAEEPDEPDVVPPEFLEVFRPEADEHLTTIASGLREMAANPGDKTPLQDVRRAVHTLKGAAGVIGLMKANSLAHRMEDLLDGAWDGSLTLNAEHQQLLFATADVLTDLIGDPSRHEGAHARRRELLRQYDALAEVVPASHPATPEAPAKTAVGDSIDLTAMHTEAAEAAKRPDGRPDTSRYVRVPIERLDEMVRLVSELVVSRSTFEQHLDSYRHDVDELRLSLSRMQRLSHRFDSDFQIQALFGAKGPLRGPGAAGDKRAEFDTLEFDRYTDLHLVSRDLGETTSDISVGVSQLSHIAGDFESYVNRLGRLTSDVQDRLMRMRMVPVANLATRLHRTVRVTADRVGKQVNLILEGEDIETDKTSLEELAGPLEHLLRNAIDHGIEPEAVRRAIGKTSVGHVTVRAFYAGTQVVLEVSDDGRGVEVEAVRRRAVAAGLIGESESEKLDESEIFDFLFEPGFSTASEVTEISGRGVGLDVVRTAVQKLKGTVKVTSNRGMGTTFHLRLPMSLAILRVLMVKARGEVYAVPLANVSRILRLESGQLERIGNRQILRLDGNVMPAIRLEEVLGSKARGEDELDELNPRQPVLIVDVGGERAAILVDELLLAREVVVKTLGSLVRKVRGVTGATILGDGGIVLIVNTSELFDAHRTAHGGSRTVALRRARQMRQLGYDVLVVDDSVSVRRVLTNLFQHQGWRPVAARDGMEALEVLQSGRKIDVVLLDMEMPRMDGYELLTLLRGQAQFATLPVIMLTSRAADKHRQKAFELGVTEFLVKPYQDEALIAVVNRVVAARPEAMAG